MLIESAIRIAEQIEGWMLTVELHWLAEQAYRSLSILEIGVWKGRSTAAICEAAAGPVIAIDHFRGSPEETQGLQAEAAQDPEGVYAQACSNLARYLTSGKLSLLRMDSPAAADRLRQSGVRADLIFLDGGHDEQSIAVDLAAFAPLVRTGGVLCGHDRGWSGVDAALRRFFPDGWELGPGSLWFRRIGV